MCEYSRIKILILIQEEAYIMPIAFSQGHKNATLGILKIVVQNKIESTRMQSSLKIVFDAGKSAD
jgi:hypothetical protein